MNKIYKETNYTFKEKIQIFIKPIKSIIFPIKEIKYKEEKGSVTLESALVMPIIALAICIILFAINIGINYMKIQDIAQNCSHIIQKNETIQKCLELGTIKENSNTKITVNEKNNYTEINVEKDIIFFPNIKPITLRAKSFAY